MREIGCLIGLALAQVASAQALGFEQPSKDELGFVQSCVADEVTCSYTRTMLLKDGRFRQTAVAILDTGDPGLLSSYSAPDAMIWSHLFDCTTDSVDVASVVGLTESGEVVELKSGFSNRPAYGHVCQSSVPRAVLDEAIDAGARYVAIRRVTTADKRQGVLGGEISLPAAARNRHLIGSLGDAILYADSTVMTQRVVRGELKGSVAIVDEEPSESLQNHHILYSNLASWKEYAVRYGRAESALLSRDLEAAPPANLDEAESGETAASIAQGLAQRIKYRLVPSEVGALPLLTAREVSDRGYGDCRDMAILLIAELERRGIHAVSVVTSTSARFPKSLTVPDLGWANHVVVYVPDLDVYFDLTAGPGKEKVGPSSKTFGSIGFRTDTGDIVIIK